MTKYKTPSWASGQCVRGDRRGLVEDICRAHGVGHPNVEWINSAENADERGEPIDTGIHGCCGCCRLLDPYD